MSSFLSWLPESGWSRLLADALWQSTLTAGIGYLAARLLTRQSAARAWLLLLTLTACVLVPLASMAARESGWAILGQGGGRSKTIDQVATSPAVENITAPELLTPSHAVPPLAASAVATDTPPNRDSRSKRVEFEALLFLALGVTWLAASILLALRLALSCVATGRLIRRAAVCDDAALLAASAAAAKRVGLAKPPVLLLSGSVRTPTIFALGAPRLLIPRDKASSDAANDIDWTAAFTHELAHAARRDGWSRMWVEFILIALPLQPLVWQLRRAFHIACEEACDDWAVATGSNPVDVAEMLTVWFGNSKLKPTLLAIGMSSTKARTLRLLSLRDTPIARLGRAWRWAGIPVLLLLVGGLAIAQSPNETKQATTSETPASTSKGEGKAANDKPIGSSGKQTNAPPYVIEPPDILTISPVQLAPRESTQIMPLDKVRIEVSGTNPSHPISGMFQVESSGEVVLGPDYGAVKISGLTRSDAQDVVTKKLSVILTDPKVALIIDESRRESGISGDHLVGPDGTINLGVYGGVRVAGLKVADARAAVEKQLSETFVDPKVALDVSKYNSKVYYFIVNVPGFGDVVRRMPTTGNETVMDAISEYQKATNYTERQFKSISIARPSSASSKRETLDVHWKDVLHGDDTTNYQILPGDRIFIEFEQFSGGGGAFGDEGPVGTRPSATKAGNR